MPYKISLVDYAEGHNYYKRAALDVPPEGYYVDVEKALWDDAKFNDDLLKELAEILYDASEVKKGHVVVNRPFLTQMLGSYEEDARAIINGIRSVTENGNEVGFQLV